MKRSDFVSLVLLPALLTMGTIGLAVYRAYVPPEPLFRVDDVVQVRQWPYAGETGVIIDHRLHAPSRRWQHLVRMPAGRISWINDYHIRREDTDE